jgi:hypothetical protein
MDIRLITVREDFEKAYNILDQKEYPLSFYEYSLKHEFDRRAEGPKLIGVFDNDLCLGTISYQTVSSSHLGKILEIREIYQTNIKSYKVMMDFLDKLAADENCQAIKICKNKAERLNQSLFDKMENFLKRMIH